MDLRPPRKRKAPKRYTSDGTWVEISSSPAATPTTSNPAPPTPPTSLRSYRNSDSPAVEQRAEPHAPHPLYDVSPAAPSLESQSACFTLPLHVNANPLLTAPSRARLSLSQPNANMANIRIVRGGSARDKDPGAPPPQRGGRARQQPRDSHQDDDESEYDFVPTKAEKRPKLDSRTKPTFGTSIATGKPAAFPTLDSATISTEQEGESYDLKSMVEDRDTNDADKRRASNDKIDRMWNCNKFLENMNDIEKNWYKEVMKWSSKSSFERQISFEQLWPSLREAIIDAIIDGTDSFSNYQSAYHPVRVLLRLSEEALGAIRRSNLEFKELDIDEQPRLLRWREEWQLKNPNKPFDGDVPPPAEIVKAIKYLRQEYLPGCLLGDWQFPCPDIVHLAEKPELADDDTTTHPGSIYDIIEINDETDVESDSEEHVAESLVAVLGIETKYLARLRKWGTKGLSHMPSKNQTMKPPPPAIPPTPFDIVAPRKATEPQPAEFADARNNTQNVAPAPRNPVQHHATPDEPLNITLAPSKSVGNASASVSSCLNTFTPKTIPVKRKARNDRSSKAMSNQHDPTMPLEVASPLSKKQKTCLRPSFKKPQISKANGLSESVLAQSSKSVPNSNPRKRPPESHSRFDFTMNNEDSYSLRAPDEYAIKKQKKNPASPLPRLPRPNHSSPQLQPPASDAAFLESMYPSQPKRPPACSQPSTYGTKRHEVSSIPPLASINQHNAKPQQVPAQFTPIPSYDFGTYSQHGSTSLSDHQSPRSSFSKSPSPAPFVNSNQFANVTLPDMASPHYLSRSSNVHELQSQYASPASAQAALQQIIQHRQHPSAQQPPHFNVPKNSARADWLNDLLDERRLSAQQSPAPHTSNASRVEGAAQRSAYPSIPTTAQEELFRVSAMQSHLGRLNQALYTQPSAATTPAVIVPSNDMYSVLPTTDPQAFDTRTHMGLPRKRPRDTSDDQYNRMMQSTKRTRLESDMGGNRLDGPRSGSPNGS